MTTDIALNDLMTFGHVVVSDGHGNVTEPSSREYGPEVIYANADYDGQLIKLPGALDFEIDMCGYGDWELLRGFTGQHLYHGAIMHQSEYIGGALEDHIRQNAGYYVAVIVDVLPNLDADEPDSAGWAVAFRGLGKA